MAQYAPITSGLGTSSTVPDGAASVTILAANSKRKGASVINTSSSTLYLNMAGDTATATTAHHVQLAQGAYFETPFGYTGLITGIWSSDSTGSANVCEYT